MEPSVLESHNKARDLAQLACCSEMRTPRAQAPSMGRDALKSSAAVRSAMRATSRHARDRRGR